MPPSSRGSPGGAVHWALSTLKWLLLDPAATPTVSGLLLLAELVVCIAVVQLVPYTEIDWGAYMDEVEGVVNGTYDYTLLKGDTGPLVYPAGFVYIFGGLYYATDHGENILRAQYIFVGVYLLHLATVHGLYIRSSARIPPYVLLFLSCTSYRIHSIFVLRLFNDPVAMLFLYLSVHMIMSERWYLGSVLFSLGVSIKMNVLLYAPGLGILMLIALGIRGTIPRLATCAAVQVVLALPFLQENFWGYMNRAFELTRQFQYKWTVNWKCLPEDLFLDRRFHAVLLALHLGSIAAYVFGRWVVPDGGLWAILTRPDAKPGEKRLSNDRIMMMMMSSNFLGMVFSRSLHYQFYVWYFHSLPYLLWMSPLPDLVRVGLLLGIEYSWNVFPATATSSVVLHSCHAIAFVALWFGRHADDAGASTTAAGPKKAQ